MFDQELPTITLNLTGVDENIDPNVDLKVYEGDLVTEFSEQPSKFAFYGGLYGDALVTLQQFENELNRYEAENENEIRQRIIARYGDKERITEAKMEAEFSRDEQWQSLKTAVFQWKKKVLLLEAIKEAFKQRASMLWSIGATRRQELVRLSSSNLEEPLT